MHIVIDMQGAQTASRFRGIGRYCLTLAIEIVKNKGPHTITLVLNGEFPESISIIKESFNTILPQDHIKIWTTLSSKNRMLRHNIYRREIAELIREAFIFSLKPDMILITSFFEGYGDDSVISIGKFDTLTPSISILYDLIPLMTPEDHLSIPQEKIYYEKKINEFKKNKLLLSLSKSSTLTAIDYLNYSKSKIVTISGSYNPFFKKINIEQDEKHLFYKKYNITKDYILYVGAGDKSKNLFSLIQAFSELEETIRSHHQLILIGPHSGLKGYDLEKFAKKRKLTSSNFQCRGYLPDEDLLFLMNLCKLFVFPSKQEGFGLPPLEAMACGVPVIASNTTSLPEIVGNENALFDPYSIESMKEKIREGLTNINFRIELCHKAKQQLALFSWSKTANKAIEAIETLIGKIAFLPSDKQIYDKDFIIDKLIKKIASIDTKFSDHFLREIAQIIDKNFSEK